MSHASLLDYTMRADYIITHVLRLAVV